MTEVVAGEEDKAARQTASRASTRLLRPMDSDDAKTRRTDQTRAEGDEPTLWFAPLPRLPLSVASAAAAMALASANDADECATAAIYSDILAKPTAKDLLLAKLVSALLPLPS